MINELQTLLNELIDGPAPEASWVLNPGDAGLLRSLDRLSAEQASRIAIEGGSSVAAHVDHLRYGLSLLNRWSQGDQNAFTDADYSASWRRTSVSEEEWAARREALRAELSAYREAIAQPRELSNFERTGVLASVVHLGYHLGAIRQMDRSLRGPSAQD